MHYSKLLLVPILCIFAYCNSPHQEYSAAIKQNKYSDTIIKNKYFTIKYSQKFKQPLSCDYFVKCINGSESRENLDFHAIEGIRTSTANDYANNEYDKGHLAPCQSFNCNEDMLQSTFTYVNCALQHEALNRGVWKSLETFEHRYKQEHLSSDVKMHIDVILSDKKLLSGAAIPSYFEKTMFVNGKLYKKWKFPNTEPKLKTIKEYEIK